ncbi:LytTR family DNA-binding domain-containing protein [Chryseobacterium sp.]|uniref:LytR/AlgR family response regulator transcription factor n=1 Tax=Chryseobacterium sp. TaxID=1871047 RepID=UPI0025BE7754|nr:LytTR family DNA-binding domain-containing protein [Chryseobacterium sp.]MBV8325123.1 response regulator transcription factor [Chryseobacterium sp.]
MINCIIVDDEPLAATLLENHISKIDHLNLVGKAENALSAYSLLQQQNIDLMFLDIQMPHLNGIDFLKSLTQKPKTIFTTAYRDFAIEGFELEAVDYILKPVTFERFFKSVERILRTVPDSKHDFIVIKTEGMHRKVFLSQIIYFESQGNDIKIVLSTKETLLTKTKMTDLQMILSSKGFVRIHRSFMINTNFITAFNHDEILLGNHQIPIGRSYKQELDTYLSSVSKNKLI